MQMNHKGKFENLCSGEILATLPTGKVVVPFFSKYVLKYN